MKLKFETLVLVSTTLLSDKSYLLNVNGVYIEFEETHQKRERVLKELYESEAQYIAKIQAAIEYYKKPMMANLKQSSSQSASSASLPRNFLSTNKSAGVIRGNEVELIFGNLEDLLNMSRRFYNGLKER